MSHIGTFSEYIEAPPDAVFARIIDVAKLPAWNSAIREVTEQPQTLTPGVIWKVRIHALGSTWVSKSEVVELDRTSRRFSYRSQSDDGNPSYADWTWTVDAEGAGAKVTVSFGINPKSFFRKYFGIHIRKPGLRKEIKASLDRLSAAVRASGESDPESSSG